MEDGPLIYFSRDPFSSKTLCSKRALPPLRTAPLIQPLSHQTMVLLCVVTEALHSLTSADSHTSVCDSASLHPLCPACSIKRPSWPAMSSDPQGEARSGGCYYAYMSSVRSWWGWETTKACSRGFCGFKPLESMSAPTEWTLVRAAWAKHLPVAKLLSWHREGYKMNKKRPVFFLSFTSIY